MKTYTLEQIEKAIDSHSEKIIEHINKSELGAGEAIDLTSKLIQISKIKEGAVSLKLSIRNELLKVNLRA